jgi:7-cyano-7-deazaguanine synthase
VNAAVANAAAYAGEVPAMLRAPRARTAVLLSGGMDSAIALHWAIARFGRDDVFAFSIDYGQQHRRELGSARRIASIAGVEHVEREIVVPFGENLLTSGSSGSLIVPGRNVILATLAAAEVALRGGDAVVIGCCADDAAGFPDCREGFIEAMSEAMAAAFDRAVKLLAPLLHCTKGEMLARAARIPGALAAVDLSWSCYRPQDAGARAPIPCGQCNACVLRARAFDAAGRRDPSRR